MKRCLLVLCIGGLLVGCNRPGRNTSVPVPAPTPLPPPLPTPDPRYEKGAQAAASFARVSVEKAKTRSEIDAFWKRFNLSLGTLTSNKRGKPRLDALNFYLQPVKEFSRKRRQELPK